MIYKLQPWVQQYLFFCKKLHSSLQGSLVKFYWTAGVLDNKSAQFFATVSPFSHWKEEEEGAKEVNRARVTDSSRG